MDPASFKEETETHGKGEKDAEKTHFQVVYEAVTGKNHPVVPKGGPLQK